jgi:hypothetical protein
MGNQRLNEIKFPDYSRLSNHGTGLAHAATGTMNHGRAD